MITIRRSADRGHFNHGWLDTYHTFSFASYFDPKFMGYRVLRVINEDRVLPGEGFPTHSHANMEIITYILEGALEHKDSMGHSSVIRPGEVQRMSAGTGITHSEFNCSTIEPVHLLQIWIVPEQPGVEPGYEQTAFGPEEKRGIFRLIASRDGREGSVTIHQDVELYATLLDPGLQAIHRLAPDRYAWIQVTRGEMTLNGHPMRAGDGASVSDEPQIALVGINPAEVLLFDMP